ncbi:MAG TPA: VTT domain-containing protein [Balneolaceae bacterium]|nr:VTT domain-containing protein [Balneolaceae bacterium]
MNSINGQGIRSKLKQFGKRLIYSKYMLPGIGLASFLESTIVPIPLETILIPLMQARRKQLFIISTMALAGCILGAFAGYAIGYFIFDAVGEQIVSLLSSQEQFENAKQQMQQKGFWFVISVGILPIPFQIAMLTAGVLKYSLILFLLAATLSRALRYYGLALLVYWAGNKAQKLFERHKKSSAIILILLVLIIWYLSFS